MIKSVENLARKTNKHLAGFSYLGRSLLLVVLAILLAELLALFFEFLVFGEATQKTAWLTLFVTLLLALPLILLSLDSILRLDSSRARLADLATQLDQRVQERTESLERALARQQILLKEVNHRIKNNLQLISSLLNLQSLGIADAKVRQQFVEACGRVATVARVHERLYLSEQFQSVDFGYYLRQLCADLLDAAGEPPTRLAVNGPTVEMPVDLVIPLGLIINELVTNAFKYAASDTGPVSISYAVGGERLAIQVNDRGIGLPDNFSPAVSQGLGMKLIEVLVQQIDGRFEYRRGNPGACFTVSLPLHGLAVHGSKAV